MRGDKAGALETLQPLLARRDPGATRVRSLVLALAGDVPGAKAALDSMIPGASRRMEPFFHRIPSLTAQQKAAAVHLGVFPDSGAPAMRRRASRRARRSASRAATTGSPRSTSCSATRPPRPLRRRNIRRRCALPRRGVASKPATPPVAAASKVWLQLASGSNVAALPEQFRRIKRSTRDLLDGLDGFVAEENNRVRLLIGPFRSSRDATIFAEDLAALNIDAFSWTNRPGQPVRKLPLE